MMDEGTKISGRKILITLLSLFALAAVGVVLVLGGAHLGRYLVYVSVPIGALLAIGASIGAMFGVNKKDF